MMRLKGFLFFFPLLAVLGFFPIVMKAQTTVTYTQQTGNYYTTYTNGTAGHFNQGSFQLGQYANTAGAKQVISFRKFRTDASGSNVSNRAMQVGDQMVVRLSATRAYGRIGFALLASPSATTAWADRENNYAISFNLDGPLYLGGATYGSWYAKFNGGSTSTGSSNVSGQQTTYKNFTFTLTLTAPDRMNATWTDGTITSNLYDIQLNTSNPITDFTVFLEDDWDGGASRNIYWGLGAVGTQHALTNTGAISMGSSNNSFTVSGVITNGLDANSASLNSLNNNYTKVGTGTVTLSGNNTYAGTTTVTGGTLQLGEADRINNSSNMVLNGGTFRTGSGAGFNETAGTLNLNANSTIGLGTGSHTLTFAASNGVAWAGNLLTVTGWTGTNNGASSGTGGKLFVGSNSSGLTSLQLSKIVFNISSVLYSAVQLSTGEVVPSGATPLYFNTANPTVAWNTANWSANNAAPYSTGWTNNRHSIFNGTSTNLTNAGSVSTTRVTANENVTITAASGTFGAASTITNFYVETGKTMDFSGGQAFSTSASYGIIKNGPGTLALAGATFAGGFTLNNGLFVARGVNAMGQGGALTINGGTIGANGNRDFTGKFTGGITIGGDFSLGSATAPSATGSNLTFTNNTDLGSLVTRTITLGGTGLYSWNGIISGTGSNLTLSATAAGTLFLGGANTYGGNTTINGGTLRPTVSGALPSTTGLIFANTSGAILDLQTNAIAPSVSSLSGGGSTGGNISFGSATTTTLTVNQSSNTTFSGLISGASLTTGGLIKTGTGTLTLGHTAHTYTGTTTITQGELRLNPGTTTATFASQIVLNGGKLSSTGITASTVWTSSNTLNLNANSTLDLGSNAHDLLFANSSGVSWAGSTLVISGWTGTAGSSGTAGRIFFGTDATGLIAGQLSKISFSGYPGTAMILGSGEIVPVAAGTTYTWVGNTSSAWGVNTNWSPSGIPGSVDNVIINAPGINFNLNITGSVSINDFTFNGTGTFSMASTGSLSVFGDIVYGGTASATMNCASTFVIGSPSSQPIPPLNYGNLIASGGDRVLPNGGTVGICGTFTRGAGAYTVTGSTVDFNGTGSQTIAFGSYNNLTISNARGAGTITLPNGTISIGGTFDVSTLSAFTVSPNASNIIDFTSASAQAIPAFFYAQINNSGNGNRTWAPSGTIDINQGFSSGSGIHTITGSTVRFSNTGSSWNLTTFSTNVAGRHYNNLIFNGTGTTWSLNGNTIGVANDLTITAGTLAVGSSGGAGTLNVDGLLLINSGTLNTTNAANAGTINLFGDYEISSGSHTKTGSTASTVNFIKSSGTQTITQSGGTISHSGGNCTWNLGSGSTTQTIQLASNWTVNAGVIQANQNARVDFQNFVLGGTSAFTGIGTSPGTHLVSAHVSGIYATTATGSIQSTGTRTFNSGINYTFNGTSAQNTGTALNPASSGTSIRNLTIDNPTTVTVTSSGGTGNSTDAVQITNTLNLNQGILILDTRDIQLNSATTITGGPFSDTKMITTIGTLNRNNGRLLKVFPATSASNQTFTFPLGDISGTAEYTPFSVTDLDYATAGGGPFIAIKVKDNRAPFDAVLNDYLTRTFEITTGSSFNGATGINFTFSANYITGASDVVGNDALFKVNRFSYVSGLWTEDAASSCGGGTLVSAALTAQGDFVDHDITGRVDADIYFRSVSSTNWESPSTWEASTDPLFVTPAPVTPSVAPISSNSAGILVRNTHNVTVTTLAILGGLPIDQTVVESGGTVTIQASCALNIQNGSGVDMEVSGTLINQSASASAVAGVLQFKNGGLYIHAVNSGAIPASTWDTGSECRITGVTTTPPSGLTQSFSDFTWSCSSMSSLNLSGGLTTVGRDFTVSNTNSATLGLTATTALALTVGRDFLVSGTSFVTLCTGATTSPTAVSMAVNGLVNIGAGGFTVAGGSSTGTGPVSLTVAGAFTNASTAGTSFVLNGNTKTNVTATITGLYTKSGSGTSSLGQAASGNSTLNCNGGLTVSGGTFHVANGGPSTLNVAASTTLLVNGGTLVGSNTAHASTINANGTTTVSSGTLTLANLASATSTMNVADNQTMTISGSGAVNVAALGTGNLNIGTNTNSVTTTALTLNGGTLTLASGGTGNLNIYGNLNLTSGLLTRSSGTANVTFRAQGLNMGFPHLQTITQGSATVTGTIAFNVGTTGTYTILTLGSNVDLGSGSTVTVTGFSNTNSSFLDFSTFTLTGFDFNQQNYGVMVTANPDGFWTIGTGPFTGSLRTTNSRTLHASLGNYSFNGTGTQVTGDAVTNAYNFSVFNNLGTLTLSNNLIISAGGTLYLNFSGFHGKLYLSNYNVTLANTASIGGASSVDYIVTNGTGKLIQTVGGSSKDFPVGLSAYNPIRLVNSGTSDTYGVQVVDAVSTPLANDDTKLINRYWNISEGVAGGSTLTTSMFMQYNGGEENANFAAGSTLKIGYFNGIAWADYAATQSGSGPYTVSPNAGFSPAVANYTLGIGKDDGFLNPSVSYTWNGSQAGGLWSNTLNWTPNGNPTGLDNVIIPDVGSYTNELNITGTRNVNDFQVNANGKFTMAAASTLSVGGTYTYSSSTPATFSCTSTLNLAGSGGIVVPAANYGNLNLSGGPRTLASSGTIGICGTYTPGTPMTITGSTVNYNGTGAQTITATQYNNLTISNARGGAALTSPAGTIEVSGTFDVSTLSAYSPAVNAASIFDFTGASGQVIPGFYYGQLNNSSNTNRTLASSGVIDIAQGFTPSTATTTITGSSVRYSHSAAANWTLTNFTTNVAGRQYNNLEFDGGGSTTWEPVASFNPGVAGNLVVSGGTLRISNTTSSNTFTVDGNTTISGGVLQVVGPLASAGITGTFITNDLSVSGTGQLNLDAASNTAAGVVTINGNTSVTSTTAAAINLGSGTANANNVVNVKGNFTKSGTGTLGLTGTYNATAIYNFNGASTQIWSHSGGAMTGGGITVASGSTLQLATNLVAASSANPNPINIAGELDCQNFSVSAGNAANTFSLNATGTIRTSSATGIAGAITGFTPAPSFASGGTFIFTGTNVNTGFSGFSGITVGNQYTITWLGSTSLTLDKTMNLNVFNFTNNGLVNLGNFSISIPSSAGALTGSGFGVGKMFVTNGTGILNRAVLSSGVGLPFTWPIGETTGATEYSPVTINSIALAGINGTIGFRVVDGVHPDMAMATSYLSRYWPCTVTGFNPAYTLGTSNFTYNSGTDVVVGPEGSLKGNSFNGTTADWTQYSSSSAGSDLLTITSGLGGASMPTAGPGTYDITGRIDVPVYYRSVSGGSWSTPGTWEISSDPAFVSPAPVTPVNPPTTANSDSVIIRNTHTVNVNSAVAADEVAVKNGGVLNITTGGTFTLPNGPGTVDMRVDGQLLVATPFTISASARLFVTNLVRQTVTGQITTTGAMQIGATGTYEHATASGASVIPAATWDVGSTCLLKYSGTTLPTGLGQAFHHFTLDADPGTTGAAGNLTNIGGNLTLLSTGSNDFKLGSGTNYTINVGGNVDVQGVSGLDVQSGGGTSTINIAGNLLQEPGTLITRSGSGTFTWNVTGDFNQSGGIFQLNVPSSSGTFNLRGNLTNNGTINAPSGSRNFNFVKPTGIQTITQTTGLMANAFTWSVGDGATTTNTLQFLSNVNLGASGSPLNFTVKSGSTVDFGTFVLSASNGTSAFVMQNNTSLITANTAGITSSGATGSVQTGTRTYTGGSNNNNFTYNSSVANQATGNGLPITMNSLTINNTGGASNNTVSMTSNNHVITTLNLSNGLLAIGSGNTTIIASGGTVNATSGDFATGSTGGMLRFSTPSGGTFTGNSNPFSVETNGNPCGINFGSGTVTIQSGGVFNINSGGFVNANPPAYASGSSLWYLTGGVYGRSLEWSSTSGKGYPHHVVVGTSTLNPASAGAVNANVPFQCAGNLTINSGGNIYMDYSGNNMTEDLRVLGNLNLVGNLSGSGSSGSDIFIGGNWTNNGVATTNFFPNGREVVFNGSSAQTIGGSNTTFPSFDYLAITTGGSDVTTNRSLTANNRLQMNSGKLIIGNNNITIGASGIIDQGGVNSYIVTNGTGFVSQTVSGGNDWFPVGPSTSAFGPVTLNQAGTGETINVRVINVAGIVAPSFQNAVNDTTQMVKLEWVMNESVAGANSLTTIFGWQDAGTAGASNIVGSAFDRTSAVYHGSWNGTKYAIRATNATSGSNPYYSSSTVAQPFTGTMAANQRFVLGNINGILPCLQTALAGDWNTASNWVDLIVPPIGSAVCINHAMTLAAAPPNPQFVTINSPNGNLSISPGVTLTFEPSGTFTNNRAGFSMTTGTVAFQGGTSTINGSQAAAFNNLQLSGNTTLTTTPTINNNLEILPNGFILSATGPNYGPSSTLIYNTGGNYNRSNEWNATSGPGFPTNVLVTGNTDLDISNGSNTARAISGNFQVDNGSSATMSAMTGSLTVPGNFVLDGSYTQSTNIGGDLILGGSWTSGASATITSNNRDVRFNSTTSGQNITVNNSLSFGYLTIDNTSTGVNLMTDIHTNTFRINPSRTFDMGSSKVIINAGGNVLINGTMNANNGTIEYTDGGDFTNNGTFNRGTSTIDFLGTNPGTVVGTVQTNFHNIRLAPSSGIDFGGGALRGKVSGTFQLRAGSYVTGNAPIYEPGSTLMYSGGGTFNRNVEWDPATVQNVEVTNNTTLKCGTNGTGFNHQMAGNLTVQSGSTYDMSGPNMTVSTKVGGNVNLLGTLTLSGSAGGDLEVAGDFANSGTFTCNGRLTTFNGSTNASISGSTNTNFCLLTVNKTSGNTLTATVPFTASLAGGSSVRVQGGTFDLNGQAITLGGGTNTLRVDAGFANGQTLKTGGTNIGSFNTYTNDGVTTSTLGGKVDYSSTGAETLVSPVTTYNMLWITGGATKSITQTTTANGDVNIDPATTLDFGATAAVLNSKADIVNQGTTTGTGLGKIEMNGTVAQNMSGNGTYRNLDINNTNNVNSAGIPTISSKLNVLLGKVLQASLNDSIILGASATLTETIISPVSQHFVRGKVHTTRVVGVAAETFGGLGVSLTAGSDLGTVEVTRLSGVALVSPITSNSGILRSWKVTPGIQPALPDRNISFTWPSQENNSLDMTTAILFKRTDGTTPFEAVTAPTDVTGSDPHLITYSGIPSFSEFTVADLNNPLPLNLLHFSGKNVGGSALLTWSTSGEGDNIGFDIMKSTDGVSFSKIGFVPSQGVSGDYRFTDNNLNVNSYYKLVQLDESGHTTPSRTVFVSTRLGESITLDLYPNPGYSGFSIRYNGFENGEEVVNLEVVNMEGKTIRLLTGTLTEINSLMQKDLEKVSTGVYVVKLQIGVDHHRLKWVKQ